MGLSNYQRQRIFNSMFGGVPYVNDAQFYFALLTAAPGPGDTGATIVEADYGGYARVSVTCNQTNWPAADSNGQGANGAVIDWPSCASGSSMITHIAVLDGIGSSANLIAFTQLDSPKMIIPGVPASFDVGKLVWQFI